jgi:8-oxo-dGTP pyrophosphatase MutT (NUDIX family)
MLDLLRSYKPEAGEENYWRDICALVETHGDRAFYRDLFNPGHITGSGLLTSADGMRVLMNHHKFLDIWICFGGHADGERDILNVALREVMEESGIEDLEPVSQMIYSVDVHDIPYNPRKNEPSHRHFDIRYLFRVRHVEYEKFVQSEESQSLRWCTYLEAKTLAAANDSSMHRLLDKWAGR